jgi:putative transposase
MRRARWLAPWKDSRVKPAIYHCISRVVERRFAFGAEERERFRIFLRMQEKFSGCRVLAYCVMSNHFHLLLEVPPPPEEGISDEELITRIAATSSPVEVAETIRQINQAKQTGDEQWLALIRERYTCRMHNLSEFMKALLIRFTRWFNRKHTRSGTLWEERFKSVIVESGLAARTIAAYIDLNPLRAGMVDDPALYHWSSYGEAMGGGAKGNGKRAREGLVRACLMDSGAGFDAARWTEASAIHRRFMGLALARTGRLEHASGRHKTSCEHPPLTHDTMADVRDDHSLPSPGMTAMLRYRIRYFSDGAVIGSRVFVNEAFTAARERFTPGRKDGARKLRGSGAPAAGVLWSIRDLRVRV